MIYKYKLTDKNNKVIYDGDSYEDMIVASQGNLVRQHRIMHINNYGESIYIRYFQLTNTKRGEKYVELTNTKRGEKMIFLEIILGITFICIVVISVFIKKGI
jgi:hypothetical protein